MILLSLETSTRHPTAAVFRDGIWLQTTATDLAPGTGSAQFPQLIRELLRSHNVSPREPGSIGVSVGPGSFTGLRIGVVMAKTWAWAAKCPLVAVDTMEAIALEAVRLHSIPVTSRIHVLVDAHRSQLFHGLFQCSSDGLIRIGQTDIINIDQLPAITGPADWVSGPGLLNRNVADTAKSASDISLAPIVPDARLTGTLAWEMIRSGQLSDPFQLLPEYIRPSAAEEKSALATGRQS